jgi:hypothetical protein
MEIQWIDTAAFQEFSEWLSHLAGDCLSYPGHVDANDVIFAFLSACVGKDFLAQFRQAEKLEILA